MWDLHQGGDSIPPQRNRHTISSEAASAGGHHRDKKNIVGTKKNQ